MNMCSLFSFRLEHEYCPVGMVPRRCGGLVLLVLSSLRLGEVPVSAERLSTRAFGLEDGLPRESVT